MEAYDPFLRARREALLELSEEDISDSEFTFAEKVIDLFLDHIDYEIGHADKVMRNRETGHLKVIINNPEGI